MASSKKILNISLKILMILIPVVLGVAGFILMGMNKQAPKQKQLMANKPTVRIMTIKPIDVLPTAIGYGTAEPIRTWKAAAQVSGKIIYAHSKLLKGSLVKAGTRLLEIDPTEYQINLTKIKANIENFKVQIRQKEVEKKNLLILLELQNSELEFKRKEADRQKALYKKKMTSKTAYEAQLQGLISQEVQVQNIQNSLNLLPIQIELLETQLAQAKSDLETAKLKLTYTIIKAPYDMQIAYVNNKLSEFVQAGQTILEANDISESEIEAQFIMNSMKPIFLSIQDRFKNLTPETLSVGSVLGVNAKARLVGSDDAGGEWKATFNRRSDTLDTETRTVGLIVSVKNDFQQIGPRRGRLLLKGAYCEVELQGLLQKNKIIIPRSALHPENIVLLLSKENKLIKRSITIEYTLGEFIVVKAGLKSGDQLILSDILPAVEGMLVDPIEDKKSFERLVTAAKGGRS